eukprot:1156210-Pelagomonas_calceolata.AAC.4
MKNGECTVKSKGGSWITRQNESPNSGGTGIYFSSPFEETHLEVNLLKVMQHRHHPEACLCPCWLQELHKRIAGVQRGTHPMPSSEHQFFQLSVVRKAEKGVAAVAAAAAASKLLSRNGEHAELLPACIVHLLAAGNECSSLAGVLATLFGKK